MQKMATPCEMLGKRTSSPIPRPEHRFELVPDRYGGRLALVFGNHAAGGVCPYHALARCFHCDIGAGEGAAFDLASNRERLAWFRDHYQRHLGAINHLVLYNSGSILNPREMPPELLGQILEFARSLPCVRVVSLESREPFIRRNILSDTFQALGDRLTLRPVLGIETADDHIRDEVLKKGMPRAAIMRALRDLGALSAELGPGRIGLDVNILLAAPGTTEETALDDALATARFALMSGVEYGVDVDLNLHPYYVGPRGAAHFPEHRRCSLATTVRAATRILELIHSMGVASSIFVGWHDEGHDRDQEQRAREIERARAAFDCFNQTNDRAALDGLEQCLCVAML
jgi:hypothetical protein